MKKALLLIQLIIIFCVSCGNQTDTKNDIKEYPRHVGDIQYDASIDDLSFKICNGEDQVFQYFNAGNGATTYYGEKPAVDEVFIKGFESKIDKSQNGLIRIRFIVNCEGKPGRFRLLQADNNFKEIEFDQNIVSQVLELTKQIERWEIFYDDNNESIDYYNYLIFKIVDGQITEILP